jgi:hypothetical protein
MNKWLHKALINCFFINVVTAGKKVKKEGGVGILPIMWLPLSKKMAAMVGCWWQPTTIV